jgi:hypothetical protein
MCKVALATLFWLVITLDAFLSDFMFSVRRELWVQVAIFSIDWIIIVSWFATRSLIGLESVFLEDTPQESHLFVKYKVIMSSFLFTATIRLQRYYIRDKVGCITIHVSTNILFKHHIKERSYLFSWAGLCWLKQFFNWYTSSPPSSPHHSQSDRG